MFWWYDTLASWPQTILHLALRAEWQRVPSGCHLAWPWQRNIWLQAAYTFLCFELCLCYDIDTLSRLEWAVFRPWKPTLLSVTEVVFEVALNTCQHTSLLFLLAILTKAAAQETQWRHIQPSKTPPAPADRLVSWWSVVTKEQQFPHTNISIQEQCNPKHPNIVIWKTFKTYSLMLLRACVILQH